MFAWFLFVSAFFHSSLVQAKPIVLKAAAYELDPYVTNTGEEQGYLLEIIKEAFAKSNYELDIQFVPRQRARALVESGQVDILIPTYSSSDTSQLTYSLPLLGSSLRYIELTSKSWKKAKTMGMAIEKGAIDNSLLKKIQSELRFNFPVEKTTQLLDMLNQKRIDVALADHYVAAQAIVTKRPHLLGKLRFVDPPFMQSQFHVGFSKKSPAAQKALTSFNQSILEIQKSGRYREVLRQYGYISDATEGNTISIVTVDNEDMKIMQKLSKFFESANQGIKIKWTTLDENILRKRILTSIALGDSDFDVFTVGLYDAIIYGANEWLHPFDKLPASYDEGDILPSLRRRFSKNGKYYALPFYGETSITYYRKDLFQNAKLTMPSDPSYTDIKAFAEKLHNPQKGIYGLCLRGNPGWGESGAYLSTLVHTFGGTWFDEKWQPQMETKPWRDAIHLYAELVKNYGPPNTWKNGYSENLALFAGGKCAMWIDATVAASFLADKGKSLVAGKVGYALSPKMKTEVGRQWNWNWALAVSKNSKRKELAQKFVLWATSKEYIALVAKEFGPAHVPPATRKSTYTPAYEQAAPFSKFVRSAMDQYRFLRELHPSIPYKGEVFIEIPEYPAIGEAVGNQIALLIRGRISEDMALQNAAQEVRNIMYQSGYYRSTSGGDPSNPSPR